MDKPDMQYPSASLDVMVLPWQSPIVLAEKIKNLGNMIWFDSNPKQNESQKPCHDIMTAAPESMIHAWGTRLEIFHPNSGLTEKVDTDPFECLDKLYSRYSKTNSETNYPFTGGLAGFWGYELNQIIEPSCIKKRSSTLPDMAVGLYLWSLVIDHAARKTLLIFHPDLAASKRHDIITLLESPLNDVQETEFYIKSPFSSMTSRDMYRKSYEKIKDYIYAGDCYQVNLTQCFTTEYKGDLWSAYRHLREISPSPFSAWFDSGVIQLSSHSPERFIKLEGQRIEACPIKGTHPRSASPEKDKQLAETLLSSTKDRSENLMIVDLLRNDLNKHCEKNSVRVTSLFSLETYSNVHHLVSTIEGKLKAELTPVQLLKGVFPGGSVTGAPKIRAMQIIRELEPVPRHAYCGAIGYISFNGNMDTNIPIRTLSGDGKTLSCWGGGAIVADSRFESEYEESIFKISNLVKALEEQFATV